MPTQLPNQPFHLQEFIDAFRIKWVYNAENQAWTKIGPTINVPIARPEDDPLGPTNGLFSARDKNKLDSLNDKAGGFGIILKPGYYLTEESGPDNILTGDVEIISESLSFQRVIENDDCGPTPTIKVGLSDDFLDSYAIEIRGPQGPKGDKGTKGQDGRPGTGDGPKGDPGEDGLDAIDPHVFTGIEVEELDEIYDTAVVGLRLDSSNGVLEVTKAKMDTPDNDKPATRVAATPVIRGIEFLSSDFSKWQIISPNGDPAPSVDLNLIKLPKGWVGGSDSPVPVTPVRLTILAQALIDHYKEKANEIIKNWDAELRNWVVATDKLAREALHGIAVKLAECQFEAPLEFCLGMEPADCRVDAGSIGNSVIMVITDGSPSSGGGYFPSNNSQYETDLQVYKSVLNSQVATNIKLGVFMPGGIAQWDQGVIPEDVEPEFSIVEVDRSPTLEQWTAQYTQLAGNTTVKNILILIDNSGSMTLSTIQPGYADFIGWLQANTGASINERTFTNARWLNELTEFVAEVSGV